MSKERKLGNVGRDAKLGTPQRYGGILRLYWYANSITLLCIDLVVMDIVKMLENAMNVLMHSLLTAVKLNLVHLLVDCNECIGIGHIVLNVALC